ncbi:MAG: PRC-barrel domain-containing protein [Planctomycetota bacterium]|jgi:sporulation protein YlmC with PRC-barrel domain|nr:PRC-barrel domain-containing protein [Planctomycetota bacterium]
MFQTMKTLKGYAIQGRDGVIGKIRDLLFDDVQWTTRYLVADTGSWLSERQVLLSPYSFASVDDENQRVVVDLTKQQIEDSPSLASDQPISRQFESSHSGYFGWPNYWGTPGILGMSPKFGILPIYSGYSGQGIDGTVVNDPSQQAAPDFQDQQILSNKGDPHLRSVNEICGYTLIADDGEVGNVGDVIIDEDGWACRYLIVATGSWWSGKNILLSPDWVEDVSWSSARAFVHMLRSIIKDAPAYTNLELLTRAYEERIHDHYQRHGYWVDKQNRDPQPT